MIAIDYMFIAKSAAAVIVVFIGYFVIGWLVERLTRSFSGKLPQGAAGIIEYLFFYGLFIFLIVVILQSFGVNLSAVLAAAGVAGVAIGFAAQTSLSNIISGIMLLFERSFNIGDVIQCEGLQGTVEVIGLLSVTLKTRDNRIIRMPNERLIKSDVINLTALKTRAIFFVVTIASSEDVAKVTTLLEKVGESFSYRKNKPISISFDASSSFATGLTIEIWVSSREVVAAKSAFVKECLDQAHAQKIPFYIAVKNN